MTILEQLAATADPVWIEMINRRRVSVVDGAVSGNSTVAQQRATEWGRKGGSHFKDGQFTKK